MIYKSEGPLELNKIINNKYVIDENGKLHKYQPFMALEQVTKQDFIDYWNKINPTLGPGDIRDTDYFYRISID